MSTRVWVRRAYDSPARNDGYRVLVDRLWPRGLTRDAARLDEWLRDVAPSDDLRRWFGHDPERWSEFRRRYRRELEGAGAEHVEHLAGLAADRRVTLVYGAKDTSHNNAVVLAEVIESLLVGDRRSRGSHR